eukprot:TRINITY_DN2198_c0_g1_i2.p1 TRINITY_DN2198_c0_g1~~TRINITY_DN2198_c0_g1_i2.p1  ORF type:complete len:269 (-),score=52.41 TRINITY_DN2198_c0_g1_i2:193-999(-)
MASPPVSSRLSSAGAQQPFFSSHVRMSNQVNLELPVTLPVTAECAFDGAFGSLGGGGNHTASCHSGRVVVEEILDIECTYNLHDKLESLGELGAAMDGLWRAGLSGVQRRFERLASEIEHLPPVAMISPNHPEAWLPGRAAAGQRAGPQCGGTLNVPQYDRKSFQSLAVATMASAQATKEVDGAAVRVTQLVEQMLQAAVSAFTAMARQREVIKSAKRRALDVMVCAGMSEKVLLKIKQRQRTDCLISYAGMLTTVLLVLVVWKLVKG